MIDCFNMAYQDKRNALQLNIKVNSENLLPHPQKCNAGSLRVPADPSWPKIPQRKLVDDFNDTIEQPCVVTLTGSPRRSRTMVQTPSNQSPKSAVTKDSTYSSLNHQRNTSSIHTLKRLPGYVDPRFKKVTNIKRNQDVTETRMSQGDMKTFDDEEMKIVSERHRIKALSREQLCDTSKIKDPNAKVELSRQSKNSEGSKYMNSNEAPVLEQRKSVKNISEKRYENDANVQVDATSLPVQENNGQLLFLLDKKLQPHPLNAIQVDAITLPQEYLNQCYNMQVPILTYKNIPVPIPAVEVNNIIQQCPISSETKNETTIAPSSKQVVDQGVYAAGSKSLTQVKQSTLNQTKNTNKSLVNETETTVAEKKHACDSKPRDTLNVQNPVASERRKNCTKSDSGQSNANTPEKLETSKVHRRLLESSDSEYYIPSMIKRKFHNSILQQGSVKKTVCNTSGGETTDSEFILLKNVQKKEYTDVNKHAIKHHKMGPYNYEQPTVSKEKSDCVQSSKVTSEQDQSQQEHKSGGYETKAKNKSEQNLLCARNECAKKLHRSSEPHITFKQKRAPRKISRKARSYFQKNSHSALMDSDYTSMWPNCQSNKYRCSHTNIHKFSSHRTKRIDHSNAKLSAQENRTNTQIDNSSNPVEQSYFQSDRNINSCLKGIMSLSKTCSQNIKCKCDMSPRSNTNDTIESPKYIPPKTQELLNKSYWEYYNKLKHKLKNTDNVDSQYFYQLAMNPADTVNETPAEIYDKNFQKQLNPELQTLQQCSALSSMINKALDAKLQSNTVPTSQLYLNGNMKSSTDPLADTQNASTSNVVPNWVNNDEPVLQKVRYRKANENDRQYLELKSIIFFGGIMYILIIFLPMLYEYFYHEVHDDYENLGYLEFIVDYILSSFKEAFGGIFSGIKQIFFYPPACKKCNNIA
ncbi:uncharacterized protein LOC143210922 [Lasioglossum baleicum]|uniref:uncharacterized protein LOC143210922 n=1 Tax=Lasioglossum baleicum TaxID=434251 RepID=UPI003FCC5496